MILLVQGQRELAQVHFDAGHKLGGEAPVSRMMGMAAQLPPDAEKRQQELYAAVLLLDPEQLEARYNVASRLLAQGRFEQAASDFRFLVERSPQVTLGMIGLAKAQVELGQVQEARLMVARVLQINKSDPDALALHARLNGR